MENLIRFLENEISLCNDKIAEAKVSQKAYPVPELAAYHRGKQHAYEHEHVTLKRLYSKLAARL